MGSRNHPLLEKRSGKGRDFLILEHLLFVEFVVESVGVVLFVVVVMSYCSNALL